jgi:hypothetical protein
MNHIYKSARETNSIFVSADIRGVPGMQKGAEPQKRFSPLMIS